MWADWYVPVRAGHGFRFSCGCGAVGYTRFEDEGFVPDIQNPDWTRYQPWTCPSKEGMWLRRFTLRNDNYWPVLLEGPRRGYCNEDVTIVIVEDCPESVFSWVKLSPQELNRLYAADPHHFNIIAREGAILGLRPLCD